MMPLNVSAVARWPGGPFLVMAACPPHQPSIIDMRTPGYMSAMLTHDEGMTWPDRRGLQILHAVLAEAGTAFLLFEDRHCAEACRVRLMRGLI